MSAAKLAPAAVALGSLILAYRQWQGPREGNPVPVGDRANAVDIMARTIWGEARGEGAAGMEAVAAVIVNRAVRGGWWGNTVETVCRKPWQFSCWNDNDPNKAELLRVTEREGRFALALDIAGRAVAGILPDPTGGATHYYASYIRAPDWVKGATLTTTIGVHRFYTGVA